ncbi:hypothetical protein [Paraburkholderia sp.]|uniref:hypothetical protein n=1 Tax=Paraburkholderia sp. TaxID=1926495 RepID=UPI002D74D674|nr:hypothetical protein [Paraburkholderia sp.]HZZ03647.1 hypothetical protein [Paraburkholderia sp.]
MSEGGHHADARLRNLCKAGKQRTDSCYYDECDNPIAHLRLMVFAQRFGSEDGCCSDNGGEEKYNDDLAHVDGLSGEGEKRKGRLVMHVVRPASCGGVTENGKSVW